MSPEMELQQLVRAKSTLSCTHQLVYHEVSIPKPETFEEHYFLLLRCAKVIQLPVVTALFLRQRISVLTSGEANPFVPRGLSPASVNSCGSLLAESKSASLAREPSAVSNTFLAEKQNNKTTITTIELCEKLKLCFPGRHNLLHLHHYLFCNILIIAITKQPSRALLSAVRP